MSDAEVSKAFRILRRLAACFLMLMLSAAAPFVFIGNHEEAARWGQVCLLVCLALLMETVLRSETIALWGRLRSIPLLGDHIPPFSNSAIYAKGNLLTEAEASALPKRRRVPLLIWSNFRGKDPDIVCSVNFLCTQILSRMGIEPRGFLALNDALRLRLAVMSGDCLQTADGKPVAWETAPQPIAHLLEDYRLLQYDVLLGQQYSVGR